MSPGCDNSYTIRHVKRMAGNPNKAMQAAYCQRRNETGVKAPV